jgi:4-hydroxymandelate oxidase
VGGTLSAETPDHPAMPTPPPPLSSIPPDIVSVEDYEVLAQERLDASVWAYLSGGAGDESTLRENRRAFERIRLSPRLFREFQGANTRLHLAGRSYDHPIFLAPTASHHLFHPEGELATVLGAAAMQAAMVVSTQASTSLEEIARVSQTPLWFQLYIQPDREFTADLVRRAEVAGYEALVVTADAPLSGLRNREKRAGFRMPPGIEAVNLRGMKAAPPATKVFGSELLDASPTWKDLAWLQARTKLPVFVKGILDPQDAVIALEQGVAGIIVSNHGGRTLDTLPAGIDALPRVAESIGKRIPIFLDGGIRRGTDIFKAVALGASAVMVGRPYLHGLAAAGAIGVAHVLKILRAELEMTMALTGTRSLTEITPATLWPEK